MTQDSIKIYKSLRAARIAAAHLRKQDSVTRCNVFLKTLFLKDGLAKRNKSGLVISVPAVYVVRKL